MSAQPSIGFTGALALLFIALKLLGHIEWSWLWVLAPVWIPLALVGIVGLVVLVVWLIAGALDRRPHKRPR